MADKSSETREESAHPMSFLLEAEFDVGIPVAGEIRTGHVVANRGKDILVDIGAKSEAIISSAELVKMEDDVLEELALGSEVQVYVINPENKEGEILVSYAKALEESDWKRAEDLLESQDVVDCRVIGFNRGGLLVRIGRIRGFVPASQLNMPRMARSKEDGESAFQRYVGKQVHTKVIEVDRSRNRLILSERAADKEARAAKRTELLKNLAEGDILTGHVVNIVDFGLFVDIGGMEGLVHISELSWKRLAKPSDFISIGEEVQVYVLNVDVEKQRVALSTKRLEPDPWSTIVERYVTGQLVPVKVTKLADYGAFARILDEEYDFEGLIHISELADDHVKHPSQLLHKGDEVTARVIRIDPEKKQIGLSIKQVTSDQYMEMDMAWGEFAEVDEEE